jgi:glutaredoxin
VSRARLAAALLASGLGVAPACSEWLVLRDGARLEIAGTPRVEGRRVLFTTPQGTLAALPAAEVDLVATEAANRAPVPEAAAKAETPQRPVRRFTDADFSHLDDVSEPTIAFYTTSWCGWCRKSRELLDQLGARYHERDVEQDAAAAVEKDTIAPESGVPVIAFGETVLTGYTERGIRGLVEQWRTAEKAAEAEREASRRPAARGAAPR